MRKWFILLLLLLSAGFWFVGRKSKPTEFFELGKAFPRARLGPLLAPSAPFSSFATQPFLGFGWSYGVEDWRANHASGKGSRVRFYLDTLLPLSLAFEARSLSPPSEVQFHLNGHNWQTLKVSGGWQSFSFPVEIQDLREGQNLLEISTGDVLAWRNLTFQPLHGGRRFDAKAPLCGDLGDSLQIPFGQSLAFAVKLNSKSRLSIADLQPWSELGSPSIKETALLVRLRSHQPELDKSWSLTGPGPQDIPLQLEGPCSVELSLLATANQTLAPGQIGLSLERPRILSPLPQPEGATEPGSSPAKADPRPSVIIYLMDALRADHLGCYGYVKDTSPQIDAFSKDGVRFANCTAQSGWTKPAVASIMTSMLPRDHQALDFADIISTSAVMLAEVLKAAGFKTRALVTNEFILDRFGFKRGFDEFKLMQHGEIRVRASQLNSEIQPWLAQQKPDQPFFLYLHSIDPHLPYIDPAQPAKAFTTDDSNDLSWLSVGQEFSGQVNPRVVSEKARAIETYDAAIRGNDKAFGELLEQLKKLKLYDSTLIVVVADHGEELLDHGRTSHGHSLYQELLHVPLIIKFPRSRGAGTVVSPLWQQIDIAPTILASCGLSPPETAQGVAYIPGGSEGDVNRPAYFSIKVGVEAEQFGQGDWPRSLDMDGVRLGSWVLNRTWACWDPRLEPEELYDLGEDPGEHHNQAFKTADITTRLTALLSLHGLNRVSLSSSKKADMQEVQKALRALQYLR